MLGVEGILSGYSQMDFRGLCTTLKLQANIGYVHYRILCIFHQIFKENHVHEEISHFILSKQTNKTEYSKVRNSPWTTSNSYSLEFQPEDC